MNAKIENALRLLGLTPFSLDEATIKKAYKFAASKYHPDKGGSVEMMQAINDAYDNLKSFNFKEEQAQDEDTYSSEDTYPDELNTALNIVTQCHGLSVEVCGLWIWVTGDTKAHKDTLKTAGFYWAKKKTAWYFRPADYKSSNRGSWDLEKIRKEHGSKKASRNKQEKLKAA